MVNRVMVVVLAAIVVTAMAVGVLAGMQFGGPDAGDAPETPGATTTTTTAATTTTTTGGTTTTATTTTTGGTTTTATTTTTGGTTTTTGVSPATVNASTLAAEIRTDLNRFRRRQGVEEFGAFGNLTAMAQFHARNVAAQGYLSHVAAGYTAKERLERFGLASQCQLPNPSGQGVLTGQELEVVVRVSPTTSDAGEIARAVVDRWTDREESREKIGYEEAEWAGIGVEVTENGNVYVVLNLC